jgi:FMN-dependent NADH-azoreductase
MANLFVINSSSARKDFISRVLVEEAVARLTEANSDAVVVRRGLDAAPVPHLRSDGWVDCDHVSGLVDVAA